MKTLIIHHEGALYNNPQANGKVERFHRTLHDFMASMNWEDTWDLLLNQTLAAIRFYVNETARFSAFYLLYNRDVFLLLDTILKPKRRYLGEDQHQIAVQEQRKTFILVHKNMKEQRGNRKN